MRTNDVRLGISGDIHKLASIASAFRQKKDHPFSNIHHFSLGLRPWEVLDEALIDFLKKQNITLSAHPTDINFSGRLNITELKLLSKTLKPWPVLYIEEDMGLWRTGKLFLGAHQLNPVMNKTSLHKTKLNIVDASEILELPITVENPPIYYEAGNIDFWDYYLDLCTFSNSQMAFDIGHYIGYCKSQNQSPVYSLPFHDLCNLIRTVHISGIKSWRWNGIAVWLDQHADEFKTPSLTLLKNAVERSCNISNILLEMEGASASAEANNIERVSTLLSEHLYHG